MLPNESLLVMLQFADYRTLVLAKLAGRHFLRLVSKYAAELARRRSFHVDLFTCWITYTEMPLGARRSIRCLSDQASLAAACRELDAVIGGHALANLTFSDNIWNTPAVSAIFEAAPSLKYAEDVVLHNQYGLASERNSEAFMSTVVGLKSLSLFLNKDVFQHFSRSFLRQESARELRRIKVSLMPRISDEDMNRSTEEFVRCCAALPRLRGGEALELDFTANDFTGAFALRIIEQLKGTGSVLTFRMRTLRDGAELVLDKRDYTVDVDGTTTRYASDSSGIVVEVDVGWITVQSTAAVPRKKRRTSEEE